MVRGARTWQRGDKQRYLVLCESHIPYHRAQRSLTTLNSDSIEALIIAANSPSIISRSGDRDHKDSLISTACEDLRSHGDVFDPEISSDFVARDHFLDGDFSATQQSNPRQISQRESFEETASFLFDMFDSGIPMPFHLSNKASTIPPVLNSNQHAESEAARPEDIM